MVSKGSGKGEVGVPRTFRFTDEEIQYIDAQAAKQKKNRSQFIMGLVKNHADYDILGTVFRELTAQRKQQELTRLTVDFVVELLEQVLAVQFMNSPVTPDARVSEVDLKRSRQLAQVHMELARRETLENRGKVGGLLVQEFLAKKAPDE